LSGRRELVECSGIDSGEMGEKVDEKATLALRLTSMVMARYIHFRTLSRDRESGKTPERPHNTTTRLNHLAPRDNCRWSERAKDVRNIIR
jgi:hypothetical protein